MAIGPVIDDNNYQNFLNGGGRGYRGMWAPGSDVSLKGFEDLGIQLIPESDWDDIIRQQQKDKTTFRDLLTQMNVPPKNQSNTNYCWVFGPTGCLEVLRLMETGRVVSYSPASAGAIIKGYRNVGGWGNQALDFFKTRGVNYSEDWPDTAIKRSYETDESEREKKKHIALEYFYLDSWQERGSCILQGIPISSGYNWWSHQVMDCGIELGDHDLVIRNSWGNWGDNGFGTLAGSKKHGDGVAIAAMTPL